MYNFYSLIFIIDMINLMKKILTRLFGNKWICEYCGATEYDFQQPYCKGCCHIQKKDIKMFKIKK